MRLAELAVLRREKFPESFALVLVQQLPISRLTLLAAVSGNLAAAPALLPVCLWKADTTAAAESHWRVRMDSVRCLPPMRSIGLNLPACALTDSELLLPVRTDRVDVPDVRRMRINRKSFQAVQLRESHAASPDDKVGFDMDIVSWIRWFWTPLWRPVARSPEVGKEVGVHK